MLQMGNACRWRLKDYKGKSTGIGSLKQFIIFGLNDNVRKVGHARM